jgi:hypothetical protein
MTYRVVKIDNYNYVVQQRFLFLWFGVDNYFGNLRYFLADQEFFCSYRSLEEAEEYIERLKQRVKHRKKLKELLR